MSPQDQSKKNQKPSSDKDTLAPKSDSASDLEPDVGDTAALRQPLAQPKAEDERETPAARPQPAPKSKPGAEAPSKPAVAPAAKPEEAKAKSLKHVMRFERRAGRRRG